MSKKQRARIAQNTSNDQLVLQLESVTKTKDELATSNAIIKATADHFQSAYETTHRQWFENEYENGRLKRENARLMRVIDDLYKDIENLERQLRSVKAVQS